MAGLGEATDEQVESTKLKTAAGDMDMVAKYLEKYKKDDSEESDFYYYVILQFNASKPAVEASKKPVAINAWAGAKATKKGK